MQISRVHTLKTNHPGEADKAAHAAGWTLLPREPLPKGAPHSAVGVYARQGRQALLCLTREGYALLELDAGP